MGKVKVQFNLHTNRHWTSTLFTRSEAPLLNRLNSLFVETISQWLTDLMNVAREPLGRDHQRNPGLTLAACCQRFWGVFGLFFGNDLWRANRTANHVRLLCSGNERSCEHSHKQQC